MNLIERDRNSIWHPFTPLTSSAEVIPIKSAKDCYLITEDGREIIDCIGSWWVNLHGHSNEYIAKKIYEQALQLEHVIFAGFTHKPAILLAERLLKILPQNQSKIFYSDNGSTSVEVALKMAFQYWHNKGEDRKKIIAFNDAYHGDTFGAMSVGGRSVFTTPFFSFLFDVEFIDFPFQNSDPSNIISSFIKICESGNVASFIFEPLVQGAAGMRMYDKEVLDKLINIAYQFDVICIADEVMTGFGRTGKLFASDHLKNKPDIICLSKGLTGGSMALGVTSCTEKIIQAFQVDDLLKTFFHGHSFTANPIACAAANASLDILLSDECLNNIKRIEIENLNFQNRIENHPNVKDVRCLGVILAIELNTDYETSYVNEARHYLYSYFLNKNILLRPLGNVIYILPPYIITDEQLAFVYNIIFNFLEEMNSLTQ